MNDAETLAQKLDAFNGDLAWEAAALLRSQESELTELRIAYKANSATNFELIAKLKSQAAEIERLETKLIECRSSVKFYCNDYDRFMLRKEPHANQCDRDEQKRLHDLLDWIDALENKHD
jgi:septal ring factor EnvC (AmiA/AmiB activator)